ncbi:MAG: hypothetical protein ACXWP5_07930, partial [Bdellovibrionota bacterium]
LPAIGADAARSKVSIEGEIPGITISAESGLVITRGDSLFVNVKGQLKDERATLINHLVKSVVTDENGKFEVDIQVEKEDQTFTFSMIDVAGTVIPIKIRIRTPNFDAARQTAAPSVETAHSLHLLSPIGRVPGGESHQPCVWQRIPGAKKIIVSISQDKKTGELAKKELGGDAELFDFPIKLVPGTYYWKVVAYGENNRLIEEGQEEFRIFPKSFDPIEGFAASAGAQFTEFSYGSTNSTFAAAFSSGMTGPLVTMSVLIKPWVGLSALWSRMDFNVFGVGVRSEQFALTANFLVPPWNLFHKFNLKLIGGLRVGANFFPEVMGITDTTASVNMMFGLVISPVLKLLLDYDNVGSFFVEARAGIPAFMRSSATGSVSWGGFNLDQAAGAGFGLRFSPSWGMQAEFIQTMILSNYASTKDVNSIKMVGYGGSASVLLYF